MNISVNCCTFNPDCSEWELHALCNNILLASRIVDEGKGEQFFSALVTKSRKLFQIPGSYAFLNPTAFLTTHYCGLVWAITQGESLVKFPSVLILLKQPNDNCIQ